MDILGGAMLGERVANQAVLKALAGAIGGVGSDAHVDRLVDLVGALVPHDLMTIVRYSATQRPEFVSHRNFSDAMVRKYLDIYYVYDPSMPIGENTKSPASVRCAACRARPSDAAYILQNFWVNR